MSIKEKYETAGQGQLFSHWALLSEDERVALERGLEEKDTLGVLKKCKEALKLAENDFHPGEVEVLPCTSYESVIDNSAEINSKYEKLGLDAIQKGEVAVILMAGGQGTRLGSSVPKGCFDIGLPSHKSLFQIQAERLQTLQRLAKSDKEIPWFIMTSQPIREDTEKFFKANNYFGLQPSQVTFFNQGTLPALDLEGKHLFLKSRTEVYESPDGNGGLYRALKDNHILEEFVARGIKHIHMYCVDNVLVKLADPVFIGYAIYHSFQLATKVVRKRDANELVGLIVSKNKHPCVLEYSEVPKEMAEAVDENSGLLKLRAANIVNHYYSVSLLQEKLDEWCKNMPYHIAKKKIKYYDPRKDKTVEPESVNGIKLEQFIFDVFDTIPMERFGCLEVERSKEFSPLKNGPDSKNDNSDTARLAYLQLSTKWLKDAGAEIDDGVLVEVSTGLSYNGESLGEFKGKKFSTSNKYLA